MQAKDDYLAGKVADFKPRKQPERKLGMEEMLAEPGGLAYYGGNRWHKFRVEAQATLEPYVFGDRD